MRIGIIGTGRIAARFADTALTGVESIYISCVYNPREESALRFIQQHNIQACTADWDEFVDNIDAAYVALPFLLYISMYNCSIKRGQDTYL